ncbi:hypothetical protein [Micromonospora aurantiaca (nom. illeg.)]
MHRYPCQGRSLTTTAVDSPGRLRPADTAALRLHTETRRLADDLGVEPGPELCEAHLRVLQGLTPTEPGEPGRTCWQPTLLAGLTQAGVRLKELAATGRVTILAGRQGGVIFR